MGRPKKINPETDKAFRSDRELVYDYQHCRKQEKKMAAAKELWDKYFRLRMKMKHELINLAIRNNIYMPEVFEEYDSEAWIKFIEQFDGIDLSRVEHLPNWSVYIRLWGYWRSMNRDLLKHWFDWKTHTTPIINITAHNGKSDINNENLTNLDVFESNHQKDVIQDDLDKNNARDIFWEAIEELKTDISPKQYQLINMKYQGKKNKEIIQTLNISGKILNEQLIFIKNRLQHHIVNKAKEKGINSSYQELVEALA